jgi:hypothetical protein
MDVNSQNKKFPLNNGMLMLRACAAVVARWHAGLPTAGLSAI